MERGGQRSRKIAVVGPCASGKSTLVAGLLQHGHDAYAVAQEHSGVRDLWKRQNPEVLVALDVSLDVVRQRRSPNWLEAVYDQQHQRLATAFASADIVINTAHHDADEVLALVHELLRDMDE